MTTVDWSPDGLQLASRDDKGVIQVLGDIELVLERTLISIALICRLSFRFFWGCSWHVHDECIMIFDRFGMSLPAKLRKLWRGMSMWSRQLLLAQMGHS